MAHHLSDQFRNIVEQGRDMGIEFPPNMPGMARIGGLHVPVSTANIEVSKWESEDDTVEYDLQIPDEKGNMFSAFVGSDSASGGKPFFGGHLVRPTSDEHVKTNSAAEFADLYRNVGPASPEDAEHNASAMRRRVGIQRLMGAGVGEMVAGMASYGQYDHETHDYVLHPVTGNMRKADMGWDEATAEWERQEQERRGGL